MHAELSFSLCISDWGVGHARFQAVGAADEEKSGSLCESHCDPKNMTDSITPFPRNCLCFSISDVSDIIELSLCAGFPPQKICSGRTSHTQPNKRSNELIDNWTLSTDEKHVVFTFSLWMLAHWFRHRKLTTSVTLNVKSPENYYQQYSLRVWEKARHYHHHSIHDAIGE